MPDNRYNSRQEAWEAKLCDVPQELRPRLLKLRPLDEDDLEDMPEPSWLIEDYLLEDGFDVLTGEPGSGKSFVKLGQGLALSAYLPEWLGSKVTDIGDGSVVYICAEGIRGLKKRIRAWKLAHGVSEKLRNFHIIPVAVNMLEKGDVNALVWVIEQAGIKNIRLIIIDTLARCFGGNDENNAKDMGQFVANCDELRQMHFPGSTISVIHHITKDGKSLTGRGSGALHGAADTQYATSNAPKKLGPHVFYLQNVKQKDEEQGDKIALERQIVSLGYQDRNGKEVTSCVVRLSDAPVVDEEDSGKVEDGVGAGVRPALKGALLTYDALRQLGTEGATFSEWQKAAKQAGVPKTTFQKHIEQLVKAQEVEKRGEGRGVARYFYTNVIPHGWASRSS